MSEGTEPSIIWRTHLDASPEAVYRLLTTDDGRARFWAESAREKDGEIHFRFPNGRACKAPVLEERFPSRYAIEYIGGSIAAFELEEDGDGRTDLTLTDAGVAENEQTEIAAGWVSVLMNLKAVVEFGVDLRNHDSSRTWDEGYVDN